MNKSFILGIAFVFLLIPQVFGEGEDMSEQKILLKYETSPEMDGSQETEYVLYDNGVFEEWHLRNRKAGDDKLVKKSFTLDSKRLKPIQDAINRIDSKKIKFPVIEKKHDAASKNYVGYNQSGERIPLDGSGPAELGFLKGALVQLIDEAQAKHA